MTEPSITRPANLGPALRGLFREAEAGRRDTEERWLRDLRQYKGVYDPEVAARLHPRRSKAFLRLTRAKVKAADARLMDVLFPGAGERNWSIAPTPVPEIDARRAGEIVARLRRETGSEPSERDVSAALRAEAGRACEAMQREMEDQLAESRYREVVREVIHSGNLYGTGVLKGPLVSRVQAPSWTRGRNGAGWQLAMRERLRPFLEFVPLWDIYPDPAARGLGEARFLFQRHLMTRQDLLALSARPDFDGAAIDAHLVAHPGGDAGVKAHESGLAMAGPVQAQPSGRYEVLEFWGFLEPEELAAIGADLGEGEAGGNVAATAPANLWLLGDTVVKAVAAPLPGQRWPYHFYYFDKDETSIFGEGLASIMRDPQHLFNASVRAMLDNAAISAGPQIEVNQDLLPEGEDPTDIHPFRVWLRSGAGLDAQYPAVRVSTLPSHAEELMAMARLFEAYAHEITGIPSSMHSEFDAAAGTVRGLSMLLSAASIALKDQIKHFDDGVTRPFITALYHWNMLFSDNEELKGDYRVLARGWSSLIARELSVEQLDAFASSTANSLDAPYIRRGELLRRRASARGLGEDIVRPDGEVQ
ncbi:hypothetical protein PCS_00030 [Desulfocurvibacter africanus PCS]|uniref:Bacteriophage head to tail connecting protein n=1 Tax=Desulfocurvibacter africanus PCS TaxID=1262666 RepID=M5PYH2_DESAF|nr:hypothetical protein [Desulfocurvibacter africanus]EMG39144.1 hypothetical protein PCS_00030 [Desulfocurvibacter africanus PCS]